jgi:hypothetical protein
MVCADEMGQSADALHGKSELITTIEDLYEEGVLYTIVYKKNTFGEYRFVEDKPLEASCCQQLGSK